ncbi:MAG TPA: alcohol dehydrogenase catalytic domain-containing protein [Thermoanaerobaculia bacterium]|jgi:propanol-preferring alcohol dehydrogenase|nr:alcohol dehydrogenase catalytic domain-containing protein [Thermoanaerobaculia bacterium]
MHAIRLTEPTQPLQWTELSDPVPDAGEIVVDVHRTGICHTDAHYRAGTGKTNLPVTLGHEVAGVVSAVGEGVTDVREGQRVALHYLTSCGECPRCKRHGEQFCPTGQMLGKERDGGYAHRIVVPAFNAIPIPDEVSFDVAAIMMCSTATAFHALRLSNLQKGESVAVLGFGGLGVSAVQLARALGASEVYAVDRVPEKLELAGQFGAKPLDSRETPVHKAILGATDGRGVDVVIEFTGHPEVARGGLRSLSPGGRLMIVAINLREMQFDPFTDLLVRERRIIGCSDHTRAELLELMELARTGAIDLSRAVTRTVPFETDAVNGVLDDLERGSRDLRTVIAVR